MNLRTSIRAAGSLLVAVILLVIAAVPAVQAAESGNGLRVSPVRTDAIVKPGERKEITVNVTNVTAASATFQAIINDFTANPNETGQPAIILNNEFAPSHSLKRFVAPIPNFTLRPGEQKSIQVVINLPANAGGGGYYGAVRFAPAGDTNNPNENVSLASSVGSLILIKVPGNVVEKLTIATFDARANDRPRSLFTSNKNITATVRFQNSGNIQVEPFGKILLKDRSNKLIGQYEVNTSIPAGSVLPESIRKFSVPLNKISGFGKYKIEGNFGYGSTGQLLSASTTFYVIPMWMILTTIAVVLFLAFLIFVLPRLIRAYNRRVLRRAGRR
jgi:hypothetical protein